jgi:hypothetical protein
LNQSGKGMKKELHPMGGFRGFKNTFGSSINSNNYSIHTVEMFLDSINAYKNSLYLYNNLV